MKNTVLTYQETSSESPFVKEFDLEFETEETYDNYAQGFSYQSPFQGLILENDFETYEEDTFSETEIEDYEIEDEIEFEELYDDELEDQEFQEYESSSDKEPIAIPVNRPVPFASTPPFGSYWPVISTHRRGKEVPFIYQVKPSRYVGNRSRSFLARRSNGARYHVGIDLYANHKDKVVACEDGKIINFYHFYRSTYALIVEHENVVINYGEVHKDSLRAHGLKKGDRVNAGQVIGFVGKMFRSSMLHFEVYRKGTTRNLRWLKRNRAPYNLLNPTKYLLFLQEQGKIGGSIGGEYQPDVPSEPAKPTINIRKAIYLNNKYSKRYGWGKFRNKINELLGISTYSSDRDLAEAVAKWQNKVGFTGRDVDGIIGPNTWKKMKANLNFDTYPSGPSSSNDPTDEELNTIPGNLGVLTIDTSIPDLSRSRPTYKFTKEDALWLARFVTGESGVKNDANGHAVIWAMYNRFGVFRHRVRSWSSFQNFLRLYSTTLQPMLRSKGAAQRVWRNYRANPKRFPIVLGQGTYKGTNMQKVQYKKHIDLQKKKWEDIHPAIRKMVVDILRGRIPNPGIGIATEFASTKVYFKQKYRRYPKSIEEWRDYTIDYATKRCKKSTGGCTWIGDRANLNQMKNAFFIDNRLKDVPSEAVGVNFSG